MNTRLIPMQFSQSNYDLNLLANPPARYVRFGSYDLDLKRQELFRSGYACLCRARSLKSC